VKGAERGAGRRGLMVAAGAAAAAAGLTAGLWQLRRAGEPAAPAGTSGPTDPWALRFPQPDGGELVMAKLRGRPLLLNFWATWCPPCIREMPEIDRFARQFAANGWQVVGLAVDQDKPVRDFLSRNPVSYPIALAGFQGIELSRSLGNDAGALPFTVAFDATGKVVKRHLGESRFELLASWASAT